MFSYKIYKNPGFLLEEKTINSIFIFTSKIIEKKQKGTINIIFEDDLGIKKLNKTYRKINKTTDVLSFHYYDSFDNLDNEEIAGEIIMSQNKIKTQSKEFGLTQEQEFYKLLIHSLLHILGYDHEEKNDYIEMQKIETKIWKEVFEK